MINPGMRVRIEDPNVSPSLFAEATVVTAKSRADLYVGRHVAGYVIRFGNGSEGWVNAWRVRKMSEEC